MKIDHFEIIFIRLLHLLAHHPDFGEGHEELVDLSQYLDFYLDLIASSETVSLIYHLALRAKTVQDSEGDQFSRNLYVISELAQELIKKRAALHSWSLPSYPGKVKLPSDVLRPFRSAESANQVAKTVYLPEETLSWLEENEKERINRERKQKRAAMSGKRKINGGSKRSRRKKRRKYEDDDNDDNDIATSDFHENDSDGDRHADQSTDPGDDDGDSGSGLSSDGEEQLGRGARSKAKAKQRRREKKLKKAVPQRRDTSPLTSASEGTGEG
jgi:sister-chromatid-cohesion protein PDS5